jgi:site-specific DNA recombinase
LRKAREGRLVAGRVPNYGFRYNEARDGYVVDEERMAVVRRIFRMVGVEGFAVYRVKRILEQEKVPTPAGGRHWSRSSIRDILVEDVYKPHSYAELEALVAPEVAARLNPEKRYGIWWFNRRRTKQRHVAEAGPSGRYYRRRPEATFRPREEWIAVPVPDAGIPQEWVDVAKEAIEDNRRPSSAGGRFWELSGGVFVCGGCGRRMLPDRKRRSPDSKRTYCYYRCWTRYQTGKDACEQRKSYRAEKTEALVREFVLNLLKDPNRLREGLKRMIERESNRSHGDPEHEAKRWSRRLAEIDTKRARFQDMAAEGLITFDELRAKLADLDEARKTAEQELETLRKRTEYIRALERDKNALLTAFTNAVPDTLDQLETEELLQLYKILRLRLTAATDGTLELSGMFAANSSVCESETTPRGYVTRT